MKSLVLFFIFSLSPLAQAFWSCPNNDRVLQASSQELAESSFWSLCTDEDIQFNIKNLKDLGLLKPDIQSALLAANQPQESLLNVSSYLYDFVSEKWQRVEGVGSLIAVVNGESANPDFLEASYYLLTASHVASGERLSVKTFDKTALPIKEVFHDVSNDISLIQLDTKKMKRLLFPLAVYFANGKTNPLIPFDPNSGGPQLRNRQSGEVLNVAFIEGLDGLIGVGARSAVPVASWLPSTPRGNGNLSLPILNRNNSGNELKINLAFPRGFSGSPVAVSYPVGPFPHYELTGILNTSWDQENFSLASSAHNLRDLFRQALNHIRKNDGFWALFDGSFIKVASSFEVFIHSGPIGNGITVDGYRPQESGLLKSDPLDSFASFRNQNKNLVEQLRVTGAKFKQSAIKENKEKERLLRDISVKGLHLKIR